MLTYTLSIHNLVAAIPTSFMGSTLTVKNASEMQFLPIIKEWMPIEIGGKKFLPLKVYLFMISVQIFRTFTLFKPDHGFWECRPSSDATRCCV